MNNILDFAVIGVQKSATTWLHECLREHPELDTKKSKDERHYYGGKVFMNKGENWYFDLFNNNGKPKVCVSVDYIKDPSAPELLKQHNSRIKLLISIRNPLKRIVSAYYWYLRKNDIDFIGVNAALEKAMTDYSDGKNTSYSSLITRGLFSADIARYLEYFDTDQLKMIQFEEVPKDPKKLISEIFEYFEINNSFLPDSLFSKPKKNTYNSKMIALQRLAPKSKIMGAFVDKLNQMYSNYTSTENKREEINPTLRKQLIEIYNADLMNLKMIVDNNKGIMLGNSQFNPYDLG